MVLAFGPVPLPPSGNAALAVNGRLSIMEHATDSLPPNVHLLTSKVLEDGTYLIRLAHLFQVSGPFPSIQFSPPNSSPF